MYELVQRNRRVGCCPGAHNERNKVAACTPSTMSAFSRDTRAVELTFSGAAPLPDRSDKGLPAGRWRTEIPPAVFLAPRMNEPPVAAVAVPPIARNRAT